MVRALNPHVADALGEWGTKHGYTAGMKIYEYLNLIAEKLMPVHRSVQPSSRAF